MLNPKGIAWVGLYAQDLQILADFYQQVLGLRLIEHTDKYCILDAGADTQFEIWANGYSIAGRKTPAQQSMIAGFSVDHLETAVAELSTRGLKPEADINSYQGKRWIYYTDPEGNRFELKDNNG